MTDDPMGTFQSALRKLLPNAIEQAVSSYQEFASETAYTDAKTFNAYHSACKTALGHVSALTKLTQWLDAHDPLPRSSSDDLETLLRQARAVLVATPHAKET